MSNANAPEFFDRCRAGVAQLLEANADFDVVERTIDTSALGREEKDALWLWAFAMRNAHRRPIAPPDRRPAVNAWGQQPTATAISVGEGHD